MRDGPAGGQESTKPIADRSIGGQGRPARFSSRQFWVLPALGLLLLTSCGRASSTASTQPVPCPSLAVPADPAGDDPDFSLYGYPQVAATQRFTPGQTSTVRAGEIVVTLPSDLYTEALDFELLIGNPSIWQDCIGDRGTVMIPYAYRVREVTSGRRVGRFDSPALMQYTDPRITERTVYWLTTATAPATAETVPSALTVEGHTMKVSNATARRGWFITIPRA